MRYNEYRYRMMFGISYEQFLDTPYEDIEWMLHMDETVKGASRPARATARPALASELPTPTIR